MNDNFTKLLQNSSQEEIIKVLEDKLKNSEEPDFWKEKILPFTQAILSVLLPLKEQNLLFNPEGQIVNTIDSELFFRWSDLVCLKTLAFVIQESNEKNELVRTDYKNVEYKVINLEKLGVYLKAPVHDEHSHPADALRYLATGLKYYFPDLIYVSDLLDLYRYDYESSDGFDV